MKFLDDGKGLVVGVENKEDLRLLLNPRFTPDLKVIGCNMTGIDHLPLEECEKRGIKVISLRDYPEFTKTITSTAEHAIGLMIALLRNYKTALNPPYKERDEYKGHALKGKHLGVIGSEGRVGQQVISIARSFRMAIHFSDIKLSKSPLLTENLLKTSDVVSLHITLEGNEGFFTYEMFKQMKSTAYLINTSRDAVIEKGALRRALDEKLIAGAAMDFIDSPDLVKYAEDHDNLLLSNHLGGCTHEDMSATEEFITQKVLQYLQKGESVV